MVGDILSGVIFRGVFERQLKKLLNVFSVDADRSFLKMCAKNLVKVTRIGEVMSRKGPPTLRNLSF